MEVITGDKIILRFIFSRQVKDPFSDVPKLKNREIFYQRPNCHLCSVAIEGKNSYEEYKAIAIGQSSENRNYVGFACIQAGVIYDLGQSVEPDYDEYPGHAHIVYSEDFDLKPNEPPSNNLDMILRKMNLSARYLIDQEPDNVGFTSKTYETKEDFPKRLIEVV